MRLIVIDPSGRPDAGALAASCRALADVGFDVERRAYPDDAGPRLAAPGVAARLALLEGALADGDVILCARGGYGMSDLLPQLDFEALAARAPSLVVGFSDISALLSALYARLGWPSLHAPMPGSPLWREDGDDVRAVRGVLAAWPGSCTGSLPVRGDGEARGPLFGGCLSVLGALVGTPYVPRSLSGHVVFLEDVNESAPRVLRHLNQWLQSGVLDGASALVLGGFVHDDSGEREALASLPDRVRERVRCPVFVSDRLGHVSCNMPLMLGAEAVIGDSRLSWRLDPGPMLA